MLKRIYYAHLVLAALLFLQASDTEEIYKTKHLGGYLNFTCTKGQMFKLDCNACICDTQTFSSVICTNLNCRKRVYSCRPFQTFRRGCNTCSCQVRGVEFCTVENCEK